MYLLVKVCLKVYIIRQFWLYIQMTGKRRANFAWSHLFTVPAIFFMSCSMFQNNIVIFKCFSFYNLSIAPCEMKSPDPVSSNVIHPTRFQYLCHWCFSLSHNLGRGLGSYSRRKTDLSILNFCCRHSSLEWGCNFKLHVFLETACTPAEDCLQARWKLHAEEIFSPGWTGLLLLPANPNLCHKCHSFYNDDSLFSLILAQWELGGWRKKYIFPLAL